VGNDTILANCTTLGGHVTIQDFANLGGFTAVHQYCQVGELAMTGAHTMLAQDVPPYAMAVGNRAKLFGINRIGLERAGLPPEEIRAVQDAYRLYFRSKLGHDEGLAAIEAELGQSERAMRFAAFIRKSTRGVCR
jgi:UDP-N-acetylglucosamine acyltransferase